MKKIIILGLLLNIFSCGSVHIAKDVKTLAFDEKINEESLKNIGPIVGKDCQWSLFGWGLGEAPTVRTAFVNAMNQKSDKLNPLDKNVVSDSPLKVLKNANVDQSGFGVWVVARRCINVTGTGLK